MKRSLTYDLDGQFWPVVWTSWDVLDFPQRENAVNYFTKNYMFSVQERAPRRRDEELGDGTDDHPGQKGHFNLPGNRLCLGQNSPA